MSNVSLRKTQNTYHKEPLVKLHCLFHFLSGDFKHMQGACCVLSQHDSKKKRSKRTDTDKGLILSNLDSRVLNNHYVDSKGALPKK